MIMTIYDNMLIFLENLPIMRITSDKLIIIKISCKKECTKKLNGFMKKLFVFCQGYIMVGRYILMLYERITIEQELVLSLVHDNIINIMLSILVWRVAEEDFVLSSQN